MLNELKPQKIEEKFSVILKQSFKDTLNIGFFISFVLVFCVISNFSLNDYIGMLNSKKRDLKYPVFYLKRIFFFNFSFIYYCSTSTFKRLFPTFILMISIY